MCVCVLCCVFDFVHVHLLSFIGILINFCIRLFSYSFIALSERKGATHIRVEANWPLEKLGPPKSSGSVHHFPHEMSHYYKEHGAQNHLF